MEIKTKRKKRVSNPRDSILCIEEMPYRRVQKKIDMAEPMTYKCESTLGLKVALAGYKPNRLAERV
mgnify:CR=1 FL=1